MVARKAGIKAAEQLIEHLPAGVRTDVERELEWVMHTEFLEPSYESNGRSSDKNELLAHILKRRVCSSTRPGVVGFGLDVR